MLDTHVKETRSNNTHPDYRVRTCNTKGNINAKNYLTNFPLFGTKYLDSIYCTKVSHIFSRKENRTQIGKDKIVEIKSSMNDFRTSFTLDHLQNFYNLKI